jgi:hypothetical protein
VRGNGGFLSAINSAGDNGIGGTSTGSLANAASGAIIEPGKIIFNGDGYYVDVTESAAMTPQVLNIEIAFKRASNTNTTGGSAPDSIQYLAFRQNVLTTAFEGYSITISDTNNSIGLGTTTAAGVQSGCNSPNNTILIGEVYHVIFTAADTEVKCYINGELVATSSKSSVISYNTTHTLKLGRTVAVSQPWDAHFNGEIYTYRMYNRVLSADDVKRNFAASRGALNI